MDKEWVWLETFKRILINKDICTEDEFKNQINEILREDWTKRHQIKTQEEKTCNYTRETCIAKTGCYSCPRHEEYDCKGCPVNKFY